MKVYIIGVGMGNPDTLIVAARKAIEASGALIGAPRLLEPYAGMPCEKLALIKPADIADALSQMAHGQVSVLMSGDVGFYSGATLLFDKLDALDCEVETIPGISSLVYFCAKLRTPWQDAVLVSAHGREHNAAGVMQASEKTFALTGGATKVGDICAELAERGFGFAQVAVGERLSYPDERIVRGTAAELAGAEFADLSVMLVENPQPVKRPFAAPALADSAFERGKAPMTKEEVRALCIGKLRIAPEHTVWDVGAGTGSVSVEAALAANRGRVFSIEKEPAALELLKHNKAAHKVANLHIVEGVAPAALDGLPAPDRVFIGGSSGNMDAIVDAACAANPDVRICATAVTLETLADLLACIKRRGFAETDIVQLNVSRADELGRYHLMRAQNPVYLVTMQATNTP